MNPDEEEGYQSSISTLAEEMSPNCSVLDMLMWAQTTRRIFPGSSPTIN